MNRLREVRQQARLSTRGLEEKSGVSRRTIMRAENGQSNPEPLTWRKLADALDTTPEVLMSPPGTRVNIEVGPDEVADVSKIMDAYRRNPSGVMGFITRRRP